MTYIVHNQLLRGGDIEVKVKPYFVNSKGSSIYKKWSSNASYDYVNHIENKPGNKKASVSGLSSDGHQYISNHEQHYQTIQTSWGKMGKGYPWKHNHPNIDDDGQNGQDENTLIIFQLSIVGIFHNLCLSLIIIPGPSSLNPQQHDCIMQHILCASNFVTTF